MFHEEQGSYHGITNAIEAMAQAVPAHAIVEPDPVAAAFYQTEGVFEAYVERSRAYATLEPQPDTHAGRVEWLTRR